MHACVRARSSTHAYVIIGAERVCVGGGAGGRPSHRTHRVHVSAPLAAYTPSFCRQCLGEWAAPHASAIVVRGLAYCLLAVPQTDRVVFFMACLPGAAAVPAVRALVVACARCSSCVHADRWTGPAPSMARGRPPSWVVVVRSCAQTHRGACDSDLRGGGCAFGLSSLNQRIRACRQGRRAPFAHCFYSRFSQQQRRKTRNRSRHWSARGFDLILIDSSPFSLVVSGAHAAGDQAEV